MFKKALGDWQKSWYICAMMCFSAGAGEKNSLSYSWPEG